MLRDSTSLDGTFDRRITDFKDNEMVVAVAAQSGFRFCELKYPKR
jgi:hypothetical protein